MDRLSRLLVRRRRWVLAGALAVFLLAGVLATGTLDALVLSRWQSPGSESMRAAAVLQERFGTASANVMVVVTAKQGTVDSPAVAAAGAALTRELVDRPEVDEATSYWTGEPDPLLRSEDGKQALIVGYVPGDATTARGMLAELAPDFTRDDGTVTVEVTGREEVSRQISAQSAQDFVRAEMIIFPLVLLLLVWMFRGIGPALATVGVGLFAMVTTMAALRLLTSVTEISTFALNITLAMGLGLGIDYCLIVLSRFREQRQLGDSRADAIARTVATAGRTVLFSGLTVAVSLLGLLLIPFPFLRAFAYAGILVVGFSMLGAVVVLPALLAATRKLGDRAPRPSRGFWHRGALAVMRRPLVYGGTAAVLLALLGAPFLGLTFGLPDERTLPPGAQVRTVEERINAGFPSEPDDALQAVIPVAGGAAVDRYAAELGRVEGVARAEIAGQQGDSAWVSIIPTSERLRTDPLGLVADVRAVDAPFGVLVGGYPAELADYRQALLDRLPWVLATIFACTFVILFLMTGSVLLPIKATVMNLLSLSAMFGVLVWGFQNGNLAGLLGFTPTGTLETSIPLLMFCIAYGLSMDYEVFMLSRIKEEYDRTGDNTSAVAHAMERSGPLITGAAAILALSFAIYATSGVVFLKMLGVGLAVAIIVDATLIRAILVPAFMRLAGKANWWAPKPLRRLHARFGLREETATT
ncbi:MMPL family transporter [Tenggerimyces flavus]|uniref:MMPL family transporter n=1 Tax=Tenggerimyces flavus TaxID=1708749 RepID=A0ABV7YK87_9ACTN|nr:MMPL family transporter [Tenggerimyces flavus]MBM7789365.1 RND superfamily putative drug exporter [Tenggerimyces flavus]